MHRRGGLIVLDRDGVLNRALGDAAAGQVLSPLDPSQVEVFPWVPPSLARLSAAGYTLCVATNQPAFAKGQAAMAALIAVQARVLEEAQSAGGVIAQAFVCYHRAEDGCHCRKPRPGLIEQALAAHPECSAADSWMVGDRATDLLAGRAAGLRTALLGPPIAGDAEILQKAELIPSYRGADLRGFVDLVLQGAS